MSIQISLDGFSFAILDIPKGKYTVLKSFRLFLKRPRLLFVKVNELLNNEELLQLKYKSVEILYATATFTLVPQMLYQNGAADKYLQFNHETEKGFQTEKCLLPRAESWCIFSMPENLKELLLLKYPRATFKHDLFPLIERALRENRNFPERKQVHLHFFRTSFEVVVVAGEKLLLGNQFNFSGDNDLIYFVLRIFDQLRLTPDTTDLVIHGYFLQAESVYQTLKKYIRKVSFAKPNTAYAYSTTFAQVPEHFFTSLLDLYKCE
ncbi:MAG: DUF3822 family protein [Marinilabiliales bacterium]|nr:DUF3822 family protein [Marinilabiliales bacterium]